MYKNNKKRIELRTRYLKELKKQNKNLEDKEKKQIFADTNKEMPNIDFNKFNNFEV